MENKTDPGKLPLRDRLEWLLLAVYSGRYGRTVDTRNPELIEQYIGATHVSRVYRGGQLRARRLADDLAELYERRLLIRISTTNIKERALCYFSYSLTATGEAEVHAIKARAGREMTF